MGRPSRHEIEKFANGRFGIAREGILAEYEKKRDQLLREVRRRGNIGGYLPALITWGADRLRKEILALADAYVDQFTRYGMASDRLAEKDLETAAQQIAAGTISSIRGRLDLMAQRTKMPLNEPAGDLNREIEAAMKSALNEGVLNLRQLFKSNDSKGILHRVDGRTPTSASEDFLERLSEDDPNYKVAKRFYLRAWADSHGLVADALSGQVSFSDFVQRCVRSFEQGAQVQVAIEDATSIPARCRELDVMAAISIDLFRKQLASKSKRLGKANAAAAIDEFSRRVTEIAARSKQRILEEALAREATIGLEGPSTTDPRPMLARAQPRVPLNTELTKAESHTADPKLRNKLVAVLRYNRYFEDLKVLKSACKGYQTPALLAQKFQNLDVWAALTDGDKADIAKGDFQPGIFAWSLVKRITGLSGSGDRTLKNYRKALRAAGLL